MVGFMGKPRRACITSKRGKDDTARRYFLMSRPYCRSETLRIVRQHWGTENCLHWTLDVVLDEDLARNRKDNGPQCRPRSSRHQDIPARKAQTRGMDDAFLFSMLRHM